MKETYIQIEGAAEEVGLKVNEDKTKVLVHPRSNRKRGQNMTISDQNFEVVNDFTYLGCNISSKRDEMKEIQRRISNANKVNYHISAIIRSGNVQRETKLKLYKTIIRPQCCGSETWTLSQRAETMVNAFERKVLRRIYGPVNHKIDQLTDRLKWTGHLQRMEESRGFSTKNWKLEKGGGGQGWLKKENRGGQRPIWAVTPLDGN